MRKRNDPMMTLSYYFIILMGLCAILWVLST